MDSHARSELRSFGSASCQGKLSFAFTGPLFTTSISWYQGYSVVGRPLRVPVIQLHTRRNLVLYSLTDLTLAVLPEGCANRSSLHNFTSRVLLVGAVNQEIQWTPFDNGHVHLETPKLGLKFKCSPYKMDLFDVEGKHGLIRLPLQLYKDTL